MTRYFFDFRSDDFFEQDEDGLEFPDLPAAQFEAARALAEHAVGVIPGWERRTLSIEVRDDEGPIFSAQLVFEVVRMRGEPEQYGRERSEARH